MKLKGPEILRNYISGISHLYLKQISEISQAYLRFISNITVYLMHGISHLCMTLVVFLVVNEVVKITSNDPCDGR